MEQEKKERIFISYKRVDKERVFAIKDGIEQATGEKCWIDLDGIESDAQFDHVIINAINRCEVFLFMYSTVHANIDTTNDWTIREINFAKAKGKRIVFINLDNAPLIDWFLLYYANYQQIDATDAEKLKYLYKDLCTWLNIDINKIQQEAAKAEQERLQKEQELQERMAQAEAAKKELEEKARIAEEKARKAEEERRVAEEKARKAEEDRHLVEEEKLHAKETADPAKHTIEEEYERFQQIKNEQEKKESSGVNIFSSIIMTITVVVKLGLIVAICWSPFALYGRFASNKFAEKGHAYFYVTNEVQQDFAEAVKKYKHALKGSKYTNPNYGQASYNLALCYEEGLGIEANNEEAFNRYLKSARLHYIPAMYTVAYCYANGELDVKKDSVKAIKWYKKASAENLEFSRDELKKTAIVRDVKEKHHEIIILPAKVKRCAVTTIGNYAFATCSIKSLEIPEGITTIENYAFAQCDSLEEIVLPNSVVSIGENAFQGCTSLSKILIPSGTRNRFASMVGLKDMEDKLVEISYE
jgi:hypothetical protein